MARDQLADHAVGRRAGGLREKKVRLNLRFLQQSGESSAHLGDVWAYSRKHLSAIPQKQVNFKILEKMSFLE